MTFKIVTDSTTDLPESWALKNDVQILGLTIQLDGTTYETVGDKKLTSEQLLSKMEAGSQPTTSQINVGQFEDIFRRYAEVACQFFILRLLQSCQELTKVRLWHGIWFWKIFQKQLSGLLIPRRHLWEKVFW